MIPKLHYISQGNSPKMHLENIQNACAAGAELVVLDIQSSFEKKFLKLATKAREITAHYQTRLIINSHIKLAKILKVDGILIDQIVPCPITLRKQLHPWQMIGATANTLQDCENYINKDVDYLYLSPFKADKHSKVAELGLNGFTAIMDILKTETPILGIGKIATSDIKAILETGISGVGVSDQISDDFNSIKVFHLLLTASSTEEQRHSFQ